ncbi:MAG: DUF5667 domain-containing protein [Patescibacteria group bacterium]|nr:DUF5667 domain-containing protein [Patescibacteria group bacterium]
MWETEVGNRKLETWTLLNKWIILKQIYMRLKFILMISVIGFWFLASKSFAVTPTVTLTVTPTPSKEVNYQLPYPGILPDNPLYPLKVFRDKIYDLLLSDPLRKVEFKLLMADKRMMMGHLLLNNKGKAELSEQTVSKASKYYEEAVTVFFKAEKEGRDVKFLRQKLIDASLKYEELITGFQKGVANDVKIGLQGSLERVLKYRGELLLDKQNLQGRE